MSSAGAADRLSAASASLESSHRDESFLPDFCQPRMVFAVVMIAELLAFVLALVRTGSPWPFLIDLGRISMFVQWLGLSSAALLCVARPRLAGLSTAAVAAVVFALTITNTAVFSGLTVWFGSLYAAAADGTRLLPTELTPFLLRNEGICVIVTALLLRYFYVADAWRRQVRAENRARIDALQARMRPHFLFNSMNTIAALTRSDAAAAEQAVEDLADLLRATLKGAEQPLTFAEELEIARGYARIESLRLGERLRVEWDVDGVPRTARLPGLTLQPLLENAIYHGIEPLPEGGTVRVAARVEDGRLVLTLTNPLAPDRAQRPGNRLALDNLRERLKLAYGERGSLEIENEPDRYTVAVALPLST
nr:sensor histidine kinase [Gammaproteobacteria bacterium]